VHEVTDTAQAVQQGVFSVDMKMDEGFVVAIPDDVAVYTTGAMRTMRGIVVVPRRASLV